MGYDQVIEWARCYKMKSTQNVQLAKKPNILTSFEPAICYCKQTIKNAGLLLRSKLSKDQQ